MDLLSRNDFHRLINEKSDRCVSILMPTHRGAESRQDPIRFKNLLEEAQGRLVGPTVRSSEAAELLRPASRLLGDSDFWRSQSGGLAVYVSPNLFRSYRLPLDLPQMCAVNGHFVLKPLLSLLSSEGMFYVLALSQNRLRLLQCTQMVAREVSLEHLAVPANLAEVLKYEVRERRQVQFHTQPASVPAGAGRGPAVFFGQVGLDKTLHKDQILRYVQQVDRGLHELLRDEQAPLVFAGVEYLFPIYRQANTYAHLMDTPVVGNPDRLSAQELRGRSWQVVQPHFERKRQEAFAHYGLAARSGLASSDARMVVPAAYLGRVGVLFTRPQQPQWGLFDPRTQSVHLHNSRLASDDDLCDFAAIQTLRHGGQVFSTPPHLEISSRSMAAIYRY